MRMPRTILACAAGLVATVAAASAGDVKEVRRTVDLAPNGRVAIDTFKGWITVETWDRPQAEIVARVEPDTSDDEGARVQAEKVAETEIRVDGSGSEVRIRSDYHRVRSHHLWDIFGLHSGTLPFVRYQIRMPRTARLEIKDYKSSTEIGALASELDLHTYKGSVAIAGMEGPVRLDTYKGDVRIDYARFDRSRFETYKGEIEIGIPRKAGFEIDADAGRRGGVDSDFGVAVQASHWRGWRRESRHEGAVNGGGPSLVLRTQKGSFRIRAR